MNLQLHHVISCQCRLKIGSSAAFRSTDRRCPGRSRSRSRLPALLEFALQSGPGRGRIDDFAAIKSGKTAAKLPVEFRQMGGAGGVVLLQKPQGFADDLACRVVPSGFYSGGPKFFQFGRERDVHTAVLHVIEFSSSQ
jgi:hypothetical protein